MYNIAASYINGFNGLGDTGLAIDDSSDGSDNKNGIDVNSLLNTTLTVGGDIAKTAIEEKTKREQNRAGDSTTTQSPTNTRTLDINNNSNNSNNNSKKDKDTDYMPWIIGGAAVLALMMVVMMSNNKK